MIRPRILRGSFLVAVVAHAAWSLAHPARPACAEVGADGALPSPIRYVLRAELGPEYDTNPARLEAIRSVGAPELHPSPLLRGALTYDLVAGLSPRQTLALTSALAGKLFFGSANVTEDVFVAESSLSYTLSLLPVTALGVAASFYDVFQRSSPPPPAPQGDPRDFRSIAPTARLDQGLFGGRLSVGGGYRTFEYKPRPAYGFSAPTAFLAFRRSLPGTPDVDGTVTADWELGASGSVEDRRFVGARCEWLDACPPADPEKRHPWRDRFVVLSADASRTSGFLIGGGAGLHLNYSNSYAQSLSRLLVHLRAVIFLPWELSLSGRGELVFTRYADGVPVKLSPAGMVLSSIEDEGRSTLRLELVRPIGGGFETGLRATMYRSAFGDDSVTFVRVTGLLFLAYVLEP